MAGNGLLENETLKETTNMYNKTAAQVSTMLGFTIVTIHKSTNERRLIENIDIFDFNISDDDMEKIDSLNKDLRVGRDPDNFDF